VNILLINPSYSNPYSQWDISDLKSNSPPLGLLSLAAIARKFGHTVKIQDFVIGNENLCGNWDLAGITAMTLQIDHAHRIGKGLRTFKVPTLLGGVHITAEPLTTLKKYPDSFDEVMIGEGEWQFSNKLGENLGLELDDLPFPAYDLVDLSKYRVSPIGAKSKNAVGLVTSRGCFGKCEFCSKSVFGNKIRCHSASYVVNLMDKLYLDQGVSDFLFYDDLFVGNKSRLHNICEMLLERHYTWSCCSRIDTLHFDTMRLMKRAGCTMIEYGIESGSQKILDLMKKGITKEKITNAIKMTRKAGILSKGNFIFGYFGETEDTIRETIKFAKNLPLDYFQHTFMTPLPGTEAWTKADQYGTFDKNWSKCNTFSCNFVPYGISRKRMIEISKDAFRSFYLRPWIMLKELFRGELILKLKSFFKSLKR
jgi:anaerobic magnesium-protoporphyrin IX monomethyl ester cyclase